MRLFIPKRRLHYIAILCVVAVLLRLIYSDWAASAYAYQGYMDISVTLESLIVQGGLLLCTAMFMPLKIDRPSDFFYLFYSWFVLFPVSIFYGISGYVGSISACVMFLALATPCFIIAKIRGGRVNIPSTPLMPESLLLLFVVVVSLTVFVSTYLSGIDFSFSFDEMYQRRLTGRDVIGTRNLLAYGFATTVNGFVPLMALLGGYRKNIFLGMLSAIIALAGFAAIGSKSPVVISILFFAIGWVQAKRIGRDLPLLFSLLLVLISAAALLFWRVMGSEVLADILLRRSFFVPPANLGFYFDLITDFTPEKIILSGYQGDVPMTYYVGEHYYGNPDTNVNINAFFLALAEGGIVWLLVSGVAVGVFFAAIDLKFKNTGHAGYLVLGAMYGLLLTEQAWTTAAITSGALILFVLLNSIKMKRGSVLNYGARDVGSRRT